MARSGMAGQDVTASINYLGPMHARPEFYADAQERNNLVLAPQTIEIRDRRHGPEARLADEGFCLIPHASAVRDFADTDAMLAIYCPEIEALIGDLTGASHIVVTKPVLRWSERELHPEFVNSRPARFVHVDYSHQAFHDFARSHLTNNPERERLLSGRYAAFNIWRTLTPPPQDCPLAVLDHRSTRRSDVIEGDAVIDAPNRPEFRFGSSLYRHHPRHRWNYYSNMTQDEALVFLAYDSADDTVPGVPHTAFDDPSCPGDAVPRSSCEIRAYVYWGK